MSLLREGLLDEETEDSITYSNIQVLRATEESAYLQLMKFGDLRLKPFGSLKT